MIGLVYAMYNLKLKSQEKRWNEVVTFDEIDSDDKWVTEEECWWRREANVEQEQPTKVEQPFHNVDNSIFDSNVEEPLSSGEKFDEDDRDLVLCFI